jgi:hypothetical protein
MLYGHGAAPSSAIAKERNSGRMMVDTMDIFMAKKSTDLMDGT